MQFTFKHDMDNLQDMVIEATRAEVERLRAKYSYDLSLFRSAERRAWVVSKRVLTEAQILEADLKPAKVERVVIETSWAGPTLCLFKIKGKVEVIEF